MNLKDLIEYTESLEKQSKINIEKHDLNLYTEHLLLKFGTIKRHLQNYEYQIKNITG